MDGTHGEILGTERFTAIEQSVSEYTYEPSEGTTTATHSDVQDAPHANSAPAPVMQAHRDDYKHFEDSQDTVVIHVKEGSEHQAMLYLLRSVSRHFRMDDVLPDLPDDVAEHRYRMLRPAKDGNEDGDALLLFQQSCNPTGLILRKLPVSLATVKPRAIAPVLVSRQTSPAESDGTGRYSGDPFAVPGYDAVGHLHQMGMDHLDGPWMHPMEEPTAPQPSSKILKALAEVMKSEQKGTVEGPEGGEGAEAGGDAGVSAGTGNEGGVALGKVSTPAAEQARRLTGVQGTGAATAPTAMAAMAAGRAGGTPLSNVTHTTTSVAPHVPLTPPDTAATMVTTTTKSGSSLSGISPGSASSDPTAAAAAGAAPIMPTPVPSSAAASDIRLAGREQRTGREGRVAAAIMSDLEAYMAEQVAEELRKSRGLPPCLLPSAVVSHNQARAWVRLAADRTEAARPFQPLLIPIALPNNAGYLRMAAEAVVAFNKRGLQLTPYLDSTCVKVESVVRVQSAWRAHRARTKAISEAVERFAVPGAAAAAAATAAAAERWTPLRSPRLMGSMGEGEQVSEQDDPQGSVLEGLKMKRRAAVAIQRTFRAYLARMRIESLRQMHALGARMEALALNLGHLALSVRSCELIRECAAAPRRLYPENNLRFAFDGTGHLMVVVRGDEARMGLPLWASPVMRMVLESEVEELFGPRPIYDQQTAFKLITEATKWRDAGGRDVWKDKGLPAPPKRARTEDVQLQVIFPDEQEAVARAALLLALTFDPWEGTGALLLPLSWTNIARGMSAEGRNGTPSENIQMHRWSSLNTSLSRVSSPWKAQPIQVTGLTPPPSATHSLVSEAPIPDWTGTPPISRQTSLALTKSWKARSVGGSPHRSSPSPPRSLHSWGDAVGSPPLSPLARDDAPAPFRDGCRLGRSKSFAYCLPAPLRPVRPQSLPARSASARRARSRSRPRRLTGDEVDVEGVRERPPSRTPSLLPRFPSMRYAPLRGVGSTSMGAGLHGAHGQAPHDRPSTAAAILEGGGAGLVMEEGSFVFPGLGATTEASALFPRFKLPSGRQSIKSKSGKRLSLGSRPPSSDEAAIVTSRNGGRGLRGPLSKEELQKGHPSLSDPHGIGPWAHDDAMLHPEPWEGSPPPSRQQQRSPKSGSRGQRSPGSSRSGGVGGGLDGERGRSRGAGAAPDSELLTYPAIKGRPMPIPQARFMTAVELLSGKRSAVWLQGGRGGPSPDIARYHHFVHPCLTAQHTQGVNYEGRERPSGRQVSALGYPLHPDSTALGFPFSYRGRDGRLRGAEEGWEGGLRVTRSLFQDPRMRALTPNTRLLTSVEAVVRVDQIRSDRDQVLHDVTGRMGRAGAMTSLPRGGPGRHSTYQLLVQAGGKAADEAMTETGTGRMEQGDEAGADGAAAGRATHRPPSPIPCPDPIYSSRPLAQEPVARAVDIYKVNKAKAAQAAKLVDGGPDTIARAMVEGRMLREQEAGVGGRARSPSPTRHTGPPPPQQQQQQQEHRGDWAVGFPAPHQARTDLPPLLVTQARVEEVEMGVFLLDMNANQAAFMRDQAYDAEDALAAARDAALAESKDLLDNNLLWVKHTGTGHSFAPDYLPLSSLAMAKLVAGMRAVYRAAAVEQVTTQKADHAAVMADIAAEKEVLRKAVGAVAARQAGVLSTLRQVHEETWDKAAVGIVTQRGMAQQRRARAEHDRAFAAAFSRQAALLGRNVRRGEIAITKAAAMMSAYSHARRQQALDQAREEAIVQAKKDILAAKAEKAQEVRTSGFTEEIRAYHDAVDALNQNVVALRRLEGVERQQRVGPAGGVWGAATAREVLKEPYPVCAVGSMADAKRRRKQGKKKEGRPQLPQQQQQQEEEDGVVMGVEQSGASGALPRLTGGSSLRNTPSPVSAHNQQQQQQRQQQRRQQQTPPQQQGRDQSSENPHTLPSKPNSPSQPSSRSNSRAQQSGLGASGTVPPLLPPLRAHTTSRPSSEQRLRALSASSHPHGGSRMGSYAGSSSEYESGGDGDSDAWAHTHQAHTHSHARHRGGGSGGGAGRGLLPPLPVSSRGSTRNGTPAQGLAQARTPPHAHAASSGLGLPAAAAPTSSGASLTQHPSPQGYSPEDLQQQQQQLESQQLEQQRPHQRHLQEEGQDSEEGSEVEGWSDSEAESEVLSDMLPEMPYAQGARMAVLKKDRKPIGIVV